MTQTKPSAVSFYRILPFIDVKGYAKANRQGRSTREDNDHQTWAAMVLSCCFPITVDGILIAGLTRDSRSFGCGKVWYGTGVPTSLLQCTDWYSHLAF